jgi:GH18 family chitinase
VAYYDGRACDTMMPESIPAGALTHINLAFIEFDEKFELVDEGGDIVTRMSKLKMTYPSLRVIVAVGDWDFNDSPTESYFSNMVSSYENRQTFTSSVFSYLTKYGLDGIDIGKNKSLETKCFTVLIVYIQIGNTLQLLIVVDPPLIQITLLFYWQKCAMHSMR